MAIPLSDNLRIGAPKPVDDRYLAADLTAHASVTAANAAIVASRRHLGLKVLVGTEEYFYKSGIADADLVPVGTSDALSGISGPINESGTKATGTITFTGSPSPGERIIIGSTSYYFNPTTSPATETDIFVSPILSLTPVQTRWAQALAARINNWSDGRADPNVTASSSGGVVTLTAIKGGPTGNAIPLSELAANVSITSAMSGGILLFSTSPVATHLGQLYYATSSKTWYRWDGEVWVEDEEYVGALSGSSPPISATRYAQGYPSMVLVGADIIVSGITSPLAANGTYSPTGAAGYAGKPTYQKAGSPPFTIASNLHGPSPQLPCWVLSENIGSGTMGLVTELFVSGLNSANSTPADATVWARQNTQNDITMSDPVGSYLGQLYNQTATGLWHRWNGTGWDADKTYTAGDGIDIAGNVVSLDMPDALAFGASDPNKARMIIGGTLTSDGSTPIVFPTLVFSGFEYDRPQYSPTGSLAGGPYRLVPQSNGAYRWWALSDPADNLFESAPTDDLYPDTATGWTPAPPATATQAVTVTAAPLPASFIGQRCKASSAWWTWNGTGWDADSYTAGTGISITGTTISATGGNSLPLAGGAMDTGAVVTLDTPQDAYNLSTDSEIGGWGFGVQQKEEGVNTGLSAYFEPSGFHAQTITTDSAHLTGDALTFDNGSKLKKGTTDAGLGGNGGIALKCSVDYELKWDAGRLYTMEQDGFTIRRVDRCRNITPTGADDGTKGFVAGSLWVLDNGTTYVCSDTTTGAAVWSANTPSPTFTGGVVFDTTFDNGEFIASQSVTLMGDNYNQYNAGNSGVIVYLPIASGKLALTNRVDGAPDKLIPSDGPATRTALGLGTGNSPTFTDLTASGKVTAKSFLEGAQDNLTLVSSAELFLTSGSVITATLSSNTPCAITLPVIVAGASFMLYLRQPSTGVVGSASWTATRPVVWPGGVPPVITPSLGKQDILSFVANQAGTKWFGSYVQNFTY